MVNSKDGQPKKTGRHERGMRFVEVWQDDREAQAEAILYLASLSEADVASGDGVQTPHT